MPGKQNPLIKKKLLAELSGQEHFDFSTGGDGSCVFCTRGARLLGIFPSESAFNVLWTPPGLKKILQGNEWMSGGERLWLSPERDFLYKKPDSFEDWDCPYDFDPGQFSVIEADFQKGLSFRKIVDIKNRRLGKVYKSVIFERSFQALTNPYPGRNRLSYSGLLIRESVRVDETSRVCINPWTLTQVITGKKGRPGTVIIPIKEWVEPLSYFNPIPNERITVRPGHLSFKLDSEEIYKLAVKPEDIDFSRNTRVLYVVDGRDEDDCYLLIKASDDIPGSQDKCFDVARSNPEGPIGVIQSYNSGPDGSGNCPQFGEVELQLNPLTQHSEGRWSAEVSHQLLVYQGKREGILALAREILNIEHLFTF